jgi:hypothetical protein
MRSKILSGVVIPIALVSGTHAAGNSPTCPGIAQGGAPSSEIDRFYAERAVSIVKAGLNDDFIALRNLVSHNAKFEIRNGDNVWVPRGDDRNLRSGAEGAIALAEFLGASLFLMSTPRTGPIWTEPLQCEWSVTVLFRTQKMDEGVSVSFNFVDGLLDAASGQVVHLYEGGVS